MRFFRYLFLFMVLSGCATLGVMEYDKQFGSADAANRINTQAITPEKSAHYSKVVRPIIENRCVVCHGCYDAPCQLKMENSTGIERGANKAIVYNGERLLTANNTESLSTITKLTASKLQEFRQQGYFPVLNERTQTKQANSQASVFYQMLQLKKQHPLPQDALLDDSFDLALDRDQQCPTIEEFEQYKAKTPLAGMPYGLPGLTEQEHNTLSTWLADGAIMADAPATTKKEQTLIAQWEQFLNGSSQKEQLVARYLYEHLYLANLYFDEQQQAKKPSYFKLVRSTTPPGQAIDIISTRRPFDSPFVNGNTQVFYRLIKHQDTIIAKRHMPYPFGQAKYKRLTELFITPDYQVDSLPDYQLLTSSNPFKTFQAIPAKSRYKFLLDHAQFSIMNFIKGPVCRGQVALNVIDDHFWVMFQDPQAIETYHTDDFIVENSDLLQLPAATSDKTISLLYWRQYAKRQAEYINKKLAYIEKIKLKQRDLDLSLLWDGDNNPNATLTVFRHFDSASVVQGFIGETPKTAWLISYPLLERIHYLLVAGFDVYGNVGHQLKTRLYMDFLRMEAESAFIALLPASERRKVHEHWYRDTSDDIKNYIFSDDFYQLPESNIRYSSKDHKQELLNKISQYTNNQQVNDFNINAGNIENRASTINDYKMMSLKKMPGLSVSLLPQVSYVMVSGEHGEFVYSLINNSAHTNVAHLFSEDDRRVPSEDNLSVVRGIIGTYPNAFFHVEETQLADFVTQLRHIETEQDYRQVKDKFAIRRTSNNFWQFADKLHAWYQQNQPESAGLLDFNRLENR
ncbi:fatty acid cis/trans isomerase [Litorilituus sediminis]|uniref:9-hexadecenoic acid cis-trans isomerase n=1 Tax=Litorilituus sediminis TaxID=718192 RepID=A0A4P6P7J3_9GAMM|nr:fatty acid cis/trans isomerase [Litorilituus sediminis]QBG36199.1 9-hexadecenoic acid cis-trans isomerase [Litorilituus sediminis]